MTKVPTSAAVDRHGDRSGIEAAIAAGLSKRHRRTMYLRFAAMSSVVFALGSLLIMVALIAINGLGATRQLYLSASIPVEDARAVIHAASDRKQISKCRKAIRSGAYDSFAGKLEREERKAVRLLLSFAEDCSSLAEYIPASDSGSIDVDSRLSFPVRLSADASQLLLSKEWRRSEPIAGSAISMDVRSGDQDDGELYDLEFGESRAKLVFSEFRDSARAAQRMGRDKANLILMAPDHAFELIEVDGEAGIVARRLFGEASSIAEIDSWSIVLPDYPATERRLGNRSIALLLAMDDRDDLVTGWSESFFTGGASRHPEAAGILSGLVGSALTLLVTFLIAFPVGVGSGIYLEEFVGRGRLLTFLEVSINNLAAVPSIVFGLVGLAVLINVFHMPRSAPLVGGTVLALMVLPTIIVATRAALAAVPQRIRSAALSLGASQFQAVFHHVVPGAIPGMMTGSIIAMARALGETAPLIMIGMVAFITGTPGGFTDPATVLPVQIYLWAGSPEPAFAVRSSAAIVVLLIFLLTMNLLAIVLRNRFQTKW